MAVSTPGRLSVSAVIIAWPGETPRRAASWETPTVALNSRQLHPSAGGEDDRPETGLVSRQIIHNTHTH